MPGPFNSNGATISSCRRAESPERDIDRAAADRPLEGERVGSIGANLGVAKKLAEHVLAKQRPYRGLFHFGKSRALDRPGVTDSGPRPAEASDRR